MKTYHFTAQIEKDMESGLYVATIPNLPGGHTQAENLSELKENLHEVVELCLEEMSDRELELLPEFIGFEQVTVSK